MKNTDNIFDLLNINKNPKKGIELTHCLQIGTNNMEKFSNWNTKKDHRYIFLGKHGKNYDKILQIQPDGDTQFFLGQWNDGVI